MEVEKIEGLPPNIAERIAPYFSGSEWIRVADEVRAGICELFVFNGGESVAVTRFEADIEELVICFYEGVDVKKFASIMIDAARKNGARTIRYHTRRKGMARLLAEYGAVETETVYTVTI